MDVKLLFRVETYYDEAMTNDAFTSANLLERIGHLSRTDEKTGDLYPAQWAALRYLSQANRFSRTPMALATYLGATRGTTSQTLMALERKGYITRKASQRDKRSIDINLSAKGKKALKADPVLQLVTAIDAAIGPQSAQLHTHLTRLLEHMIRQNEGQRFGACHTCRHFRADEGGSNARPHFCGLLEEPLSDSDKELICVEQE